MTIQELRARRKRLGISQHELGFIIGTGKNQVSTWETGFHQPRPENRKAWEQALQKLEGQLSARKPGQ